MPQLRPRDAVKFGLLFGLWVILSGRFELRYLLIGVLAAGAVVIATRRLAVREAHPPLPGGRSLHWGRFLFSYLPWLLWQIVLANVQVATMVLSRRIVIDPCILEIPTALRRGVAQTVLGNSITLTPGTLTVDIREGTFLVHALAPDTAGSLFSGEMQGRVAALFDEEQVPPAVHVLPTFGQQWRAEAAEPAHGGVR